MLTFLADIQLSFKQRGDLAGFLIAAGYQLPAVAIDELSLAEWDKPARDMFMAYHRFRGLPVQILENNIVSLNDGLNLLGYDPAASVYAKQVLSDKRDENMLALAVLKKVNDFIEKHNLQKE
jgi:hypothetical protein